MSTISDDYDMCHTHTQHASHPAHNADRTVDKMEDFFSDRDSYDLWNDSQGKLCFGFFFGWFCFVFIYTNYQRVYADINIWEEC